MVRRRPRGVEAHLDHLSSLGANVLYLTPVFPAESTHRYDASSFEHVDPLLGGDEAFTSLVRAAHDRGIRVVGDLTTNHVGAEHEWFRAASNGGAERDFFVFDDDLEHGYECWWGIPSLPKLDYRSDELRERMYDGEDSVVRRWLRPPYDLDGWRIDVANMTGRLADVDVLPEVARGVGASAVATRPDAVVVAEHAYDVRADLRAGGWHGAMNYAGFTRPVWTWLRGDDLPSEAETIFFGAPVGIPRLPGESVVRTMTGFRAGIPWSASLHSWAILDSHDVIRFRTLAGSRERQLVGVGLQMTTPGVPMVFAGDEIGLEGDWGEDARRTMPWSRPGDLGHRAARHLPPARRAAPEPPRARARRDPLRRTSRATRSRTCARRGTRRCSASRRAQTGRRSAWRSPRPSSRRCSATTPGSTATRSSCPRAGRPSTSGESHDDGGEVRWLTSSSRKSTRSTRAACTPCRTSRCT